MCFTVRILWPTWNLHKFAWFVYFGHYTEAISLQNIYLQNGCIIYKRIIQHHTNKCIHKQKQN